MTSFQRSSFRWVLFIWLQSHLSHLDVTCTCRLNRLECAEVRAELLVDQILEDLFGFCCWILVAIFIHCGHSTHVIQVLRGDGLKLPALGDIPYFLGNLSWHDNFSLPWSLVSCESEIRHHIMFSKTSPVLENIPEYTLHFYTPTEIPVSRQTFLSFVQCSAQSGAVQTSPPEVAKYKIILRWDYFWGERFARVKVLIFKEQKRNWTSLWEVHIYAGKTRVTVLYCPRRDVYQKTCLLQPPTILWCPRTVAKTNGECPKVLLEQH